MAIGLQCGFKCGEASTSPCLVKTPNHLGEVCPLPSAACLLEPALNGPGLRMLCDAWVSQFPKIKLAANRCILIFEKLRSQATSSKFQTPTSKEAPSSKLKNGPARRLPRHSVLGFGV